MRTLGRRRSASVRVAAAIAMAMTLAIALLAPTVLGGARFGRLVEGMLPPTCGRIEVGGGRWTWGSALAALRGRPVPLELTDVRITDPAGTEVLRIRRLSARIELTRDHRHATIRDLRIDGARWRFAQMADGRGIGFLRAFQPARDADTLGPGRCPPVIAAPSPSPAPEHSGGGAAPGPPVASASSSSSFEIVSASLAGLDVVFDLPGWGLSLDDVYTSARLAIPGPGPTGGPISFVVSGAQVRGGGELRVLSGAASLRLPFARAVLEQVSATPDRADAISVKGSLVTGRSTLVVAGAFTGVFDLPGRRSSAGIELQAHLDDGADAIQAIVAHLASASASASGSGSGALSVSRGGAPGTGVPRVAATFSGRFDQLHVEAEASGFDVTLRQLTFNDVAFHVAADPVARRMRLSHLSFGSPQGGRMRLDGELQYPAVTASVAFERLATQPWLPALLLPILGGTLDGALRGHGDLETARASVDGVDVALRRPPGVSGPPMVRITDAQRARGLDGSGGGRVEHPAMPLRVSGARFVDGTFYIPQMAASLWAGRLAAGGRIAVWDRARGTWLPSPVLDLTLRGDHVRLDRLTGVRFATGAISFRATAQGRLADLRIGARFPKGESFLVLGQRFRLPESVGIRLLADELSLPEITLVGAAGGALTASGTLHTSGAIDLGVGVREFPLGKLPGLAQTDLPVTGRLNGRVRLSGDGGRPTVSGRLDAADVSLGGQRIGAGALTITPAPSAAAPGGMRVRGNLGDVLTAEATLTPDSDGLRGDATVGLRRLRLDPFLSGLPGGVRATGMVSGTASAHMAPGQPPSLAGTLTELVLTVAAPPAHAARGRAGRASSASGPIPASASRSIELRAQGDIPWSREAPGVGRLKLGPARFTSDAGAFELTAEHTGGPDGNVGGTFRGRLNLTTLAPLLEPWLAELSGAIDLDLALRTSATRSEARAPPRPLVTGSLTVAAPVAIRPIGAPFGAGFPGGRIDFTGARASTQDLRVTLGRGVIALAGALTLPHLGPAQVDVDLRGQLDAHLLELLAPRWISDAEGMGDAHARVVGALPRPSFDLAVDLPRAVSFRWPQLPGRDRIQVKGGPLVLSGSELTLRSVDVNVGTRIGVRLGAADGAPARLRFDPWQLSGGIGQLDIPASGQITGLSIAFADIDRASYTLRLQGEPPRRMLLSGDVQIQGARVSSQSLGGAPHAAPSSSRNQGLLRRYAERTDVDLRVRAQHGALTVKVPYAPDPRLNVDLRIGGTLGHPTSAGEIRPTGIYSFLVLVLHRLLQ